MDLKDIKTCKLVEELSKREGVEVFRIGVEENKNIKIEGPVVVLKVID